MAQQKSGGQGGSTTNKYSVPFTNEFSLIAPYAYQQFGPTAPTKRKLGITRGTVANPAPPSPNEPLYSRRPVDGQAGIPSMNAAVGSSTSQIQATKDKAAADTAAFLKMLAKLNGGGSSGGGGSGGSGGGSAATPQNTYLQEVARRNAEALQSGSYMNPYNDIQDDYDTQYATQGTTAQTNYDTDLATSNKTFDDLAAILGGQNTTAQGSINSDYDKLDAFFAANSVNPYEKLKATNTVANPQLLAYLQNSGANTNPVQDEINANTTNNTQAAARMQDIMNILSASQAASNTGYRTDAASRRAEDLGTLAENNAFYGSEVSKGKAASKAGLDEALRKTKEDYLNKYTENTTANKKEAETARQNIVDQQTELGIGGVDVTKAETKVKTAAKAKTIKANDKTFLAKMNKDFGQNWKTLTEYYNAKGVPKMASKEKRVQRRKNYKG